MPSSWCSPFGRAILLALASIGVANLPHAQAVTWSAHRAALLKEPGLTRYYTFENAGPTATSIANLAQSAGGLTYQVEKTSGQAAEPLRVIDGRWPGKKAVRIDLGYFTADTGESLARGFTVEAWIRLQGVGRHRGNAGSTNGAIVSLGSGYWDGWRLTTGYPERALRFEIGRPKPSHAIGLGGGTLADNVWQHLAAVWDGQQMQIYVDGLLAASAAYDGVFTLPTQAQAFRIGFANSGVGSVVLDVDEAAVFRRALSADEILRHAYPEKNVAPQVAAGLTAAAAALQEKRSATTELEGLVKSPDLSPELIATARQLLAESLCRDGQFAAAGVELARLIENPQSSDRRRSAAQARLLRLFREAPGTALPEGALQRVLSLAEVTANERLSARLTLGHAALAAGDFAAARAQYALVLAQSEAPVALRSLAQLHIAQSYLSQRDFAAAQREYAQVAAIADAPPHHRWEAEQQIAASRRLAAGKPARDPAASRLALPKTSATGVTIYVAAHGADTNPGTRERPLATLQRARDELRSRKLAGKGAEVLIGGGAYPVRETFQLTAEDSGTAAAPIVYRAVPGETPRFTGGVRLRGFQAVTDPAVLERLLPEVRAKIVAMDLESAGLKTFPPLTQRAYASGAGFKSHPWVELFCDGRAMPLARWPNEGFTTIADICHDDGHQIHNQRGSKIGEFLYEGDRPGRWLKEPDALLYGYWFWSWADSYERVKAIDPQRRQITLAQPCHRYGFRKGQPYYAANLLCEIDRPGEWYLDRQSHSLYFYPPGDVSRSEIVLSTGDMPFVQMDNTAHVRLEGLAWEYGRTDAVVIRGGRGCVLAGCTIRHFAGNGVDIQGGVEHGLLSCDIYSLGRGAIRLAGGDRKTLTLGKHFVENCHIYDLSRIDHTYTPAVWLTGVGARIVHNLMHDIPSSAINLAGNEHLVELNEVYRVVHESDDQGGIDMFGNPTYRGNVFRYNYWHHIGQYGGADYPCGQAGIRLDDAICGTLIYGNVFYRSSSGRSGFGGVQIHGGKDNWVDNNLFADCTTAVSFSPWGPKRWAEHTAKYTAPPDIDRQLYHARYPALARLGDDPDVNTVCRSLAYNCREFARRDRGRSLISDNLATGVDPGFTDVRVGNFALRPETAGRSPFAPIPFAEIGLYHDDFRKALPAKLVHEARAAD